MSDRRDGDSMNTNAVYVVKIVESFGSSPWILGNRKQGPHLSARVRRRLHVGSLRTEKT